MNAVARQVLDDAIDWQLCLDSGDATDQERQAFAVWLAAHPEHARAWQQLGGLDQQLAVAEPAPARRALVRRPARRRLGPSLLALVLLGGLLLGLSAQRPLSDFLADEITARGEQRSLLLPDQTRVHLNSASALDIDFTAQHRHLTLRSGEILVETAKGDSRPLWVMTEHGRLRPLGTRFLVRLEKGTTRLTVLQSSVAAYAQTAGEERIIEAGEQVVIGPIGLGASQAASYTADAWSRGMLVVDDVPLGEFIARLGEQRRGYLGLDPRLAQLRISGSFPLHDTDLALAALVPSVPVLIQRYTAWWVKVVPR
jgi:transmembrane sensor